MTFDLWTHVTRFFPFLILAVSNAYFAIFADAFSEIILNATAAPCTSNSCPVYKSSVFSRTITISIPSFRAFMPGYDFAGRIFAYKSSILRNTTITSAADSPTGAFMHTSDFLIAPSVWSGNAFPNFANAISPASNFSILNLTSNLSWIVFNTEITDSDNSGPMPSPVINEILYMTSR